MGRTVTEVWPDQERTVSVAERAKCANVEILKRLRLLANRASQKAKSTCSIAVYMCKCMRPIIYPNTYLSAKDYVYKKKN